MAQKDSLLDCVPNQSTSNQRVTRVIQFRIWKEISAMGELIIELPFEVRRRFRITDAKAAADVIEKLEKLERQTVGPAQEVVTDDEVLNVWANREETPDEIARQLRQGNRRHG